MKDHITPEVGDVWEYADGHRVYVFDTENMICALAMVKGGLCYDGFKERKFLELHKYLGKSKANIDDLFKTENEE